MYRIEAIAAAVERSSRAQPAALVGQFLRVVDLVAPMQGCWRFRSRSRAGYRSRGVDVSRLLRQAMRRELALPRLVAAALYERLAYALTRSRVRSPCLVLHV